MSSSLIEIPDFKFTGHYYHEILEDLVQYKRINVSELTDEDPTEPFMQFLMSTALVGHLNNVLLDMVAKETMFLTCALRSSIQSHLALIGYVLAQPSPATAEELAKLVKTFATATEIVPAGSLFATEATSDLPSILFEALSAVEITESTQQVGRVFAWDETNGLWTDHTAEARTYAGSFNFAVVLVKDALYIGHPDVLFDKVRIKVSTGGTNYNGVWEYYDGKYDEANPDNVTNLGSELEFEINNWLGSTDYSGMVVRVVYAPTGVYEEVDSYFVAGVNKVKTGFLGQSSPSTDPNDYLVGTAWNPLEGVVDPTNELKAVTEGDLEFTFPKTVDRNWVKTTINGVEGYWIRFRITLITAPTNPAIDYINIDTGSQYIAFNVTQGQSQIDNPLGSSTGLPSQVFRLTNYPVIDDENLKIYVDEGGGSEQQYIKVDSFISSSAFDRHFRVSFDDEGHADIIFGDGDNGRIPPAGTDNIRAEYRTMEDINGNVGANTIVVNRAGVSYLEWLKNPKDASGYVQKDGHDAADIARLKDEGPASIRTLERACTPQDVEELTLAFRSSAGSKLFARAKAVEEAYGPKTVEVIVVGINGGLADSSALIELEEYFNGVGDVPGVLAFNHELTVVNFNPKTIDVTATVYGGNQTSVETALAAALTPLAKEADGINWLWEFGEEVPTSMIISIIMGSDPQPRKVVLTVPAADVTLTPKQLPTAGTLSITVLP